MVTIVKHEWHQVDSQFAFELSLDKLQEIYPDSSQDELTQLLSQIENNEIDVSTIVEDAFNNDVVIEWERQYDDWYTDRKGGYDVTYELGDEDSWHSLNTEAEPEPTHKCVKCRWTGQSYQTLIQYLREDNSVIENYHDSVEDYHFTKEVCPMCDNDIVLTEKGKDKEKRFLELMDEINSEIFNDKE